MLQIKNTLGGGKPEGLYVWKKNEIGSELKVLNKSVSTLPYNFYQGSAVVLDGEIHIFGGISSKKSHYKWNGSSWVNVSTLPYNFYQGSAVVLDGEIHIFGGYDTGVGLNHYKWDGSSWTSVSTLPYVFYKGSAVVLNNEIHILGGTNNATNHYKFDGTSWTSASTLPYDFYYGSAVVLNREIHILGGNSGSNQTKHYKFDGTSWTSASTLPYGFYRGSAVVFENKIHILGGSDNTNKHYKWDGNSWTSVSTLPYNFVNGSAVVYNNGIHILGSENSNYYTAHYLIIGYVPVYIFLDYIVSDKETAYPDGGEKGGYWYEKVGGNGLIPLKFNADGYTTKAKYNGDTIPAGLFYVGYKAGTYSIDTQCIGYHISELEIDAGVNIGQYAFYQSRITSLKILNNTIGSIGTYGFYGVNLLNLQDIETLTINGDLGIFAIEGIQANGALPEKIKFKGSSIGEGGIANCYGTPNPSKLWISNNCRTIAGASSSNAGIYNSPAISIYCEPSSKPSGWGSSWYYNCGSIMWGVTESAFDAL